MRSLFLVVCLLLVASSAPAQVVEESLSRDPGPLDFIQGEGYEQWIFQALAGDALVGLDPKGEPVPRLAYGFKLLKDGRISFTLRSDVHFPDGNPLRPEDVLWTFQELLRNPKASPTKRAIFQGAAVGLDRILSGVLQQLQEVLIIAHEGKGAVPDMDHVIRVR